MALKSFTSDQNPRPGKGINKWASQSDLKFYKSKEAKQEKPSATPLREKEPEQNIIPTGEFMERPGLSKSKFWGEAVEQTNRVLKSITPLTFCNELEFPKYREKLIKSFEKEVCLPQHVHDMAINELRKSATISDLKYRLALLAKSFAFARIGR